MSSTRSVDVSMAPLLEELPGMELAEMDALAALQIRRDRKYLLAPEHLAEVLARTDVPLRVLDIDGQRSFPYRSTYFDTPDLLSYHDAARSRPRRFKVRSRTYLATSTCWLEVKSRNTRGQTIKERIEHPLAAEAELPPMARSFLECHEQVCVDIDRLAPTLVTGYERATIYCGQRATIDAGLRCTEPDGTNVRLGALGDLLIIETKSLGHAPGPFDRALWRLGIRPSTISKYAVGTAVAHPTLGANKWHRVLQRQVGRTRDGERA